MVAEWQRNAPQGKSNTTTEQKQSKEQVEGKVGLHIAESSVPTNNDSTDTENTNEPDSSNEVNTKAKRDSSTEVNAKTDNNHDKTNGPMETQSTIGEPVAQVGFPLGCDNYVLSAEEA